MISKLIEFSVRNRWLVIFVWLGIRFGKVENRYLRGVAFWVVTVLFTGLIGHAINHRVDWVYAFTVSTFFILIQWKNLNSKPLAFNLEKDVIAKL